MKKYIQKIKYFLFHNNGYRIQELIYDYEDSPQLGYILHYEWVLCGIRGCDTIAICCDKEKLNKELKIRDLTFETVLKYK